MRRAAVLATLGLLSTAGCAATSRAGARADALVDYQRALDAICEGRAAKAVLRSELDEKQRMLDWRASEIAAARAKLDRRTLSDREREAREAELDGRERELRELFARYQTELAAHERDAVRRIFERMSEVVREISTQRGYGSVVAKGEPGSRGGGVDITDELVARYDARFPVAGCAPTKPGQPPDPLPPPARPLGL